jgi:hypothetical protein
MLCRQCGSLWESLFGHHTTVHMTISQPGIVYFPQSLQICYLLSCLRLSPSVLLFLTDELRHDFRKEYVDKIINRGGNQTVEAR